MCRARPCSAIRRDGAGDHASLRRLRILDFVGPDRIDQDQHVEIAVADMAGDGGSEPVRVGIGPRFGQAFGEPRDRHADIGDHGARRVANPDRHTRASLTRLSRGSVAPLIGSSMASVIVFSLKLRKACLR
jgi:hypothetical protein